MAEPPPITNRVRELREAHGAISQTELGQAIGVTRQTIIAIEQDRYSPSLVSAFRIARYFGLGVEDVFGWTGSVATPETPARAATPASERRR